MTFRSPGISDTELSKLIERTFANLDSPASYMIGKRFEQPLLPQNILLFSRRGAASLFLGKNLHDKHHRYVLVTAVKAGGMVGIDKRTYTLLQGESLLVCPYQSHWYVELDKAANYWIFITFEHARHPLLEAIRDRGSVRDPGRGLTHLHDFLLAWHRPEEHESIPLRLATWLHNLSRQASKKHQPCDLAPGTISDMDWAAEINRFVFGRRESNLTLMEVARHLRISASVLRARFHQISGRSIGSYIRALKLQYACELLHDTDISIGDVATRCGYESAYSFSRAFFKAYSMRPSAYRKEFLKAD